MDVWADGGAEYIIGVLSIEEIDRMTRSIEAH